MDSSLKYRLFNILASGKNLTQRSIASELGISLGAVNHAIRCLAEKGYIKLEAFCNSPNKRNYSYLLTPDGLEEKARITVQYFREKMAEYEKLRRELSRLEKEVREIERYAQNKPAPGQKRAPIKS